MGRVFIAGRRYVSASSGTSYSGPADAVGVAPAAFWGLRAVSAAYATAGSACMDVTDSAGANTTTINFLSSGGIDTTALSTFIAAHGTASVHQIYEQIGTKHLLNATAVSNEATIQPNAIASLPSLKFVKASSQTMLKLSAGLVQSLPLSMSVVCNRTGTGQATVLQIDDSNIILGYATAANTGNIYNGTGASFTGGVSDNTWLAMQAVFGSTASSSTVLVNGTSNTGLNSGTTSAAGGAIELGSDTFNDFLDGQIMEAGVWTGSLSGTNQTALTTNQRNYYGF